MDLDTLKADYENEFDSMSSLHASREENVTEGNLKVEKLERQVRIHSHERGGGGGESLTPLIALTMKLTLIQVISFMEESDEFARGKLELSKQILREKGNSTRLTGALKASSEWMSKAREANKINLDELAAVSENRDELTRDLKAVSQNRDELTRDLKAVHESCLMSEAEREANTLAVDELREAVAEKDRIMLSS